MRIHHVVGQAIQEKLRALPDRNTSALLLQNDSIQLVVRNGLRALIY
jgi:hypothetical protein